MQEGAKIDEKSIFEDVSSTIKNALEQIKGKDSDRVNLFQKALKYYIKY